ncbi:aspartate transcarbamoylase, putative [Babesia bigemina]|uniref:aspartate carbamoyltransferase n=1 Tax=Babesia bigemina TaxID=5866 RepID=A0A061D4Z9_BABBI|nr:aspartate transcarbamoylase, putative [Babesia bigemina]CDR95643.1 aspartate transcarbamoylase, putative [Babesia bigemina]|eukprot:XP_012767829.1 aspartate transcarbamoylase, putative [Babesia bigemina]
MSRTNAGIAGVTGVGVFGAAVLYASTQYPSFRRQLVRLGICDADPLADTLEPLLRWVAMGMRRIDIVSVDDLSNRQLTCIMELAGYFKEKVSQKQSCELLQNKIMVTLFHEASTRTRCSFEAAMLRLGGKVVSVTDPTTSSAAKGETIEDSVRVLSSYADVLVLRHPEKGCMERVRSHVKVPLINAGDGSGEHPSQALLDLYTISTFFPILQRNKSHTPFTICFVGDLKNGRAAHSLAKLLSRFNVVMRYVAPPQLQMPTQIQREVENNFAKYEIPDLPFPRQTSFSDIEDGCEGTDVIYVTRLQKERMNSEDAMKLRGSYSVQKSLIAKLPPHVKIMHPLPRVDELPRDIDADGRAVYFEQAENGLYVRMAMLYLILNAS